MKHLLPVVVLLYQLWTRTQSIRISRWNACAPDGTNFRITYGMSILQCMRECHLVDSCKSVSYQRLKQQCRLNLRYLESLAGIATCPVDVLVNKQKFPLNRFSDADIVPVVDMNMIPARCSFVKNVDEISVAVSCSTDDKLSLYTEQPDGSIANHMTVFRAISGNGHDPYVSWMTGENVLLLKTCVNLLTCSKHFRHYIVDWWERLAIQKVRVSFKKYTTEVAYFLFRFQGQGHDIETWFDQFSLIESTWPAILLSTTPFQHFSQKGEDHIQRRFFVCLLYNGCGGDLIYTMIQGKPDTGPCPWDYRDTPPQFLYSDKQVPSVGTDLKLADTFEVVLYF